VTAVRVGAANDNLGPVRAVDPRAIDAMRRYADASVPAREDPRAIDAMRRYADASVPARDIAATFGVSVRTVYRYLRDPRRAVTVRVGDWEADFSTGGEQEPQRLTAWRVARLDAVEQAYMTARTIRELENDEEARDGR
jgi:hypothetical protein